MSFALGLSLLVSVASPRALECDRSYAPSNEIRLVDGAWQIGTADTTRTWTPLSCNPSLNAGFLGSTDIMSLEKEGEGHVGQGAAFVFYPSFQVPEGSQFTVNPMGLFGANPIRIDLPDTGWAFLDRDKYQQLRSVVGGVPVEVDSEPSNPEIQTSLETFGRLVSLFPYRASQIAEQGQARIILAMNATEKFWDQPIVPNGLHHRGNPYYAVLFSQDGMGVLSHTLHEIGGLFRIFGSSYAHGLTWMVAFDQMEKLAPTSQDKLARKCIDLDMAISQIKSTAVQNGVADYSHPMEYYMAHPLATGGWGIFAWVSGLYWKKTNSALDAQGLADVYGLLNSIHEFGLDSVPGDTDLDKLIAAYARMSPATAREFQQLALRYFRQENLGQLKREAEAERAELKCQGN